MQTGAGRPSKINDEIIKKIAGIVRQGNYIETAAAAAGINKTTLYAWLKRGQRAIQESESTGKKIPKKESLYAEFSNAIEKAWAGSEMDDVAKITKAARYNWTAAAWRLERKFPDRWGKKFQQIPSPEEQQMRLLEIQKMQLELKKMELELLSATGGDEEDAHAAAAAFSSVLKSDLKNIYPEAEDEADGS